MKTEEQLEQEARSMTVHELLQSLDWNMSLAEHFDENMDYNGYKKCVTKINVVKIELARRNVL